jgi:geranylgeranyl reductase family protein
VAQSVEQRVDALIIGAGPAGSAAAIALAKGGASVALVDRHEFPRDKVCGDALIPDALRALDRLALREAVLSHARVLSKIRIYTPNHRFVVVQGECACVPRGVLDDVLRLEAVRLGVSFRPRLRLATALSRNGVVHGAVFDGPGGRRTAVEAGVTLLATGAAAEPLKRFQVCERIAPSATAARMYFQADEAFAREFDYLCLSYDRATRPGYGWIFPGPGGLFNVGVIYYYDAAARSHETNIRVLLERFLSTFPRAMDLTHRSRALTDLRGAPLRTAFTGATLAVPGLLVIGEAAGLTYSFSGEGIGKAMASGLMAADVILKASSDGPFHARVARDYTTRMRSAFAQRFKAYKLAQDWLTRPAIGNLLAWRAGRSRFLKQELERIFTETSDPRGLFSAAGMIRTLVS